MEFQCDCGNVYASRVNLRDHQRRFCRGAGEQNNDCPYCNISFAIYRGMRQHLRHRHPQQYNAEMKEEVESRPMRLGLWAEEEIEDMAIAEARDIVLSIGTWNSEKEIVQAESEMGEIVRGEEEEAAHADEMRADPPIHADPNEHLRGLQEVDLDPIRRHHLNN
ncbi:hypothetical protein HHI36_023749 [Cryptolaemus montrouzieri]|uniref:C2H2-type domain-containing protein n=1 Tax=Cryptolaemus montrouzieri TaxID=559131 RepID=A0ABD2PHT1_9CUCU